MTSNNKLIISIFVIPVLIFVGILFFNNINKAPTSSPMRQGQNQQSFSDSFNFTANEVPAFNFPSVAYASDLQKNVSIYNSDGEKMNADVTVSADKNGSSVQVNKTQQFTPGKYSLVINQDGKKIEQDFTWGVLAINPNKSIYAPGEVAKLALAVLDEKGNMVCDANVTLDIKDPSGQTTTLNVQNGTITVNPECQQKKYTVNPDYETKYQVGALGNYQMSLTAVTKNGTYNIVDFFTVEENREFDVERTTGTRIFPYSIYPVSIKIIAKKDFTGQIRELAPASLTMTPLENTVSYNSIEKNTEIQYLVWDVSLKKGESINIGYNFKAPLISPQFYLLGPLHLVSGNTSVFEEKRAWQLAIDAVSYSTTILNTSGLVAYWQLDEASGNFADSAGSYTAIPTGSPTYGVTGLITGDSDTAVTFNGSTSVDYSISGFPVGNAAWSMECWAKVTSAVNHDFIAWGTQVTNQDVSMRISNVGALRFNSHSEVHAFGGSLLDGNPHHIVLTYDGTLMKGYIDGSQIGADWDLTSALALGTTRGQLAVWSSYLAGTMDEAAIYNVVLTPTQISEHFAVGQPYKATVLSDGPIAYWRLGETSGTNANDEIGTADGTYTGTYTQGVTGALAGDPNTALSLVSTGYVTIPDSTQIDFDDVFSIEFWFKQTGNWDEGIVGKGWDVGVDVQNGVLRLTAGGNYVAHTTGVYNDDAWHHVVVTKNGSARHIYIDGTDDTTLDTNYTNAANSVPLIIGGAVGASFRGSVDEAAIYNVVLTPAQVLSHYIQGISQTPPRNTYEEAVLADSPAVVFPMDEASGNITDIIGGKTGTANGTPTYGVTGPVGGLTGISFDNIADFFSVADHADLDLGNGPFTIEFWLKRDADNGGYQGVVRKGVNAYTVNITGESMGGTWKDKVGLGKQGVTVLSVATATVPVDATWRHFVITHSAAGAGNTLVYTNAVEGHIDTTSINETLSDTAAALEIGFDDTTLDGAVAYIALYKSVLSQARIQAHYDAGPLTPTPTPGASSFQFNGLRLNGIKIN